MKQTKPHKEMVAEWKNEPDFVQAYDELETEFMLLRELIQARQEVHLVSWKAL